ncbi:uncharacterized protein TNCV_1508941 [Trichonephila clavipes]|nr:uncharacterized protein TNCV_1508941 [Trichonephila clavipes]
MELLRNCKNFFNDLRSDGAFAEMLRDAKELADEIDIPANFEVMQPRHKVRRKNANFDYEARVDPVENPKLKFKIELYFFAIDQAINALECRFNLMSTHNNCFQFLYNICDLKDTPKILIIKNCKNLEMMLTDGESVDINALDLADEIIAGPAQNLEDKNLKWRIKAIDVVVLVEHDDKIKGKDKRVVMTGGTGEQRTKREGVDTESIHNVMPSAGR